MTVEKSSIFGSSGLVENKENPTSLIKEVLTIEGIEPKREGAWLDKFPGLIRPTTFKWQTIKF